MVEVGKPTVHDVGRIMNEKTARSQVTGGVIYALGQALTEKTNYDHRFANVVTRTLADYHVPVQLDVPPIDVLFVGKSDPHISPIGALGPTKRTEKVLARIGENFAGAQTANLHAPLSSRLKCDASS